MHKYRINRLLCGFLVLTYGCNNRCKWCYAAPAEFRPDFMDLELAKQFLDLMKSLQIKDMGFCGGEPTTHPHLMELIKYAKDKGFCVTLYTNGRKLSDEKFVKQLKSAGLDFCNLSIQSNDEKVHDEVCQVQGAFKETKAGIENCHKYEIALNLEAVFAHTNLKIYKTLIDEFAYAANKFIFFRETPPVTDNILSLKVLSNADTRRMIRGIFKYAKQKNVSTYFFSRMPFCWFQQDDLDREIAERIVSHCHVINGQNIPIDVDGKILPCPQWINLPSMNLVKNGKVISKEEFLKEWNTGKPQKVREDLTYLPHENCKTCDYFGRKCTGGCPLVEFEIPPT